MKRSNIFKLAAALLSLTSCTDYLGIKPKGFDVPSRIEHYEGLIYGTESTWIWEVFPYMSFEQTVCNSDAYSLAYSSSGAAVCNAYKWQADIYRQDDESSEWNSPAKLIYPLNVVVNGVKDAENGTPERKLALQSEARVLRAYQTFIMAQFFSRPYNSATAESDLCIPIITKASTMSNDFSRRTVREVYDFIVREMTESIPYLPDEKEHISRAFKFTGLVMLGKVQWMMGEWDNAADTFSAARECMSTASCSILDYASIVNGGTMAYPVDDLQNPELIYNLELLTNLLSAVYAEYYGTPTFSVKPEVLLKYFDKDDLRLCAYSGIKSGKTAYNNLSLNDTYYVNTSRLQGNIGVTVPDFYLMYAEVAARTGDEDLARELLTQLRRNRMDTAKAEVTASGDDLVRFAVEEGFREHMGYGNNWFDMRRLWNDPLFQDLKQMYVHSDGETEYRLTEDRLVMRIPPSILQWHPEYVDNQ